MNKLRAGDELTSLHTEVQALRLAKAAIERQMAMDAEGTNSLLRTLESQRNALREANLRLLNQSSFIQRVMDSTGALMIVLRPDGRIRQVNRRCAEALGESGMPLEGRVVDEWLHPEERRLLAERLPNLPWPVYSPLFETMRRAGSYAAEHRLAVHDGRYRQYWLEASLQHNPQGKEEGAVLCATDITLIKQQQDRLRRSESLLREVQQIAQLGYWELDLASGALAFSEEVCRIFEFDLASPPPTFADFLAFVHPDDRPAFDETYSALLNSRQACTLDHRLLLAGGRVKWVHERLIAHGDASGQARREGEGAIVLAAIIDITERKRLEVNLRQVVESAPNGIVMVNHEGRIALFNAQAEQMFGTPRAELVGQPVEVLLPERYRSAHAESRSAFFATPRVRAMGMGRDLYARRRDGSEFPVEIGLNPIETAEGAMVLVAIVDITERKLNQESMARALEEKTTLLNEVHHRVKNNLQVVSSLFNLQAAHTQDAGVRQALSESQGRVRAMALIHQLLYESHDFSRIHFGDYLERLGQLLVTLHSAKANRIAVRTEVSGEPVYLNLHRAIPCGLLVTELVTNAFKHAFPTGSSGEVHIKLATPLHGEAVLAVIDDGAGLPEGFQLGQSASLGLKLVQRLAEQVKGRLVLDGGAGTSFFLYFKPLIDSEET